jgi:hypothetical protein
VLLGLTTCAPEVGDPAVDWDIVRFYAGPAPWDGFTLDVHETAGDGSCGPAIGGAADGPMPLISGPDGGVVLVGPVGDCTRWVPAGGFEPGKYTWVGFVDPEQHSNPMLIASPDDQRDFTVVGFGRDPEFDRAAVAGQVFALDVSTFTTCPESDLLVAGVVFLEGVLLQVLQVDGESAAFRIVYTGTKFNPVATCTLLEDEASLSSTGEFTWSRDHGETASDPPLDAWNLFLHFGFSPAEGSGWGLEVRGTFDLEPLEAAGWEDLCSWHDSVGSSPCGTCPDGDGRCVTFDWYWGRIVAAPDISLTDDLPHCFADPGSPPEADTGLPACEPGCSGARPPTGLPGPWIFLPAVVLRRRRARD